MIEADLEGSPVIKVKTLDQWNDILDKAKADEQTVIVDFFATWCGPCRMIAPKYKQMAQDNPDTMFLKVDVDILPSVAQEYKVNAMPTFAALTGYGATLDTVVGVNIPGLKKMIEKHAVPPLTNEQKAEKAEKEGDSLLAAGDCIRAADRYTRGIELAPDSAMLYAKRASAYLKQMKVLQAKAMEDAEKATELDNENGAGWLRKGEALLMSADCGECKGGEGTESRMQKRINEAFAALENAIAYSKGEDREEAKKLVIDAMDRKALYESDQKA